MAFFPDIVAKVRSAWQERAVSIKALSFGVVGVVNAAVDYAVFFIALLGLHTSLTATQLAASASAACNCLSAETWLIIPANVVAWLVAVSGSYVMNSLTTFARESGGRLRWRSYGAFVASGIAGVVANTATVLVAVQFMPVWAAKLIAIFVSFAVNFSLSHFVVFRRRPAGERG
jgi:putative flippase GtrA